MIQYFIILYLVLMRWSEMKWKQTLALVVAICIVTAETVLTIKIANIFCVINKPLFLAIKKVFLSYYI